MGKELGIPAHFRGQPASDLHYITDSHIALPLEALLDGIQEFAGIVGYDGTLLYRNAAWRELAGSLDFFGSERIIDYLLRQSKRGCASARGLREAFESIMLGEEETAAVEFTAPGDTSARFSIKLYKLVRGARNFIYVTGSDVSEVVELRRSRRQLGAAVLHAQERERKRIGRELHDSTLQLLVGLQLNLARMKMDVDDNDRWAELLGDCDEVLALAYKEIRSLSYLYHPPAMGEQGLVSALEALVAGFAKRTGLTIERDWSDIGFSMPLGEIALYRFAQEALTNIFRHAKATVVKMRLAVKDRCLHLIIEDDGIGSIPSFHDKTVLGVGVTGMAERMRELGGRVSTFARAPGVVLIASVPLPGEG